LSFDILGSASVNSGSPQLREHPAHPSEPKLTEQLSEAFLRTVKVSIVTELAQRVRRKSGLFRIDLPGMKVEDRRALLSLVDAG